MTTETLPASHTWNPSIAPELIPSLNELLALMDGSGGILSMTPERIETAVLREPESKRSGAITATIEGCHRARIHRERKARETPDDFDPVCNAAKKEAERTAPPKNRSGFYLPAAEARRERYIRIETLRGIAAKGLPDNPDNESQLREWLQQHYKLSYSRPEFVAELTAIFPGLKCERVTVKKIHQSIIDRVLRRAA